MVVRAAFMAPSPTPRDPSLCLPASLPSQTVFSRYYPPSPAPTIITTSNSEKQHRASLLISSHILSHGFLISAPMRRRRASLMVGVAELDNAGDGWDEEDEEKEEDDDEGEELMPLQEMNRWLRNKPAGFGEGKVYDTTMEQKLLEEIELSQKAQVANINKLRSGAAATNKQDQKDIVVVPNGTRVRVSNLPRKKNIHRDLQLAFKGFPGIINIDPSVAGNKKTRDPVCKGSAFIDLASEKAADRFVQQYSKQHVMFGKVQKLITCTVVNPSGSSPDATEKSTQNKYTHWEDEIAETSKIGNRSRTSIEADDENGEEIVPSLNGTVGDSSRSEESGTAIENLSVAYLDDAENCSQIDEDGSGLNGFLSSLQKPGKQEATRRKKKKKKVKSKSVKSSAPSLPPSMVRLKVKERTLLTGVFSKYGGKVASALSRSD